MGLMIKIESTQKSEKNCKNPVCFCCGPCGYVKSCKRPQYWYNQSLHKPRIEGGDSGRRWIFDKLKVLLNRKKRIKIDLKIDLSYRVHLKILTKS